MDFFNSLVIRTTLAVIGGIFYAFLTYAIVMSLHLSYEFVIVASVFVYLFYLAQGFFSSSLESTPPIIQKEEKDSLKHLPKKILSISPLNGSENSITIMTSFFLLFWVSSPYFSSSLSF